MLKGKRIILRAVEIEDLPVLVRWRNDPEVYDKFFEHEPLSLAMQKQWFERFLQRGDEKFWIAEPIDDPQPIGMISLVNIDMRNRKAELGRVLVYPVNDRRSGCGQEMCALTLKYAYEHLNLNRIYLDVFRNNQGAIDFYKKMGFSEEGCFRQHIFSRGEYQDVLVLALLRQEYLARNYNG